ncbi:hypothetical protein F5Y15DRAFT_115437 [Xylariaceae sp. FL0016]|nr:hypothetical protein F5Y15DRAFT_115437 [Xylariaceae sp. FL0016]
MTSHYPLNDINLEFRRYAHRPIGVRDVLINHLVENWVDCEPNTIAVLDLRSTLALLDVSLEWLDIWPNSRFPGYSHTTLCDRQTVWKDIAGSPAMENDIMALAREQHLLGHNSSLQYLLKLLSGAQPRPKRKRLSKDKVALLKPMLRASTVHHKYQISSGSLGLPSLNTFDHSRIAIAPAFIAPTFQVLQIHSINQMIGHFQKSNAALRLKFDYTGYTHRGKPRRSQSLPPPGLWYTAKFQTPEYDEFTQCFLFYPGTRRSETDKVSRRRSLSRTHIRKMFHEKPEWIRDERAGRRSSTKLQIHCTNCAQYTHLTRNCTSGCGYCNSEEHKARNCTVKAVNRCKCQPFPQFHTASKCHVTCSRRCDSPYPPGHFRHKNAIFCAHRCCMCGIKGHSGRKCSLKKCPCGEQHLTQDCRWKVECPAKQCNKYLCDLHCRECGKKKEKGMRQYFVGRTCPDCLKNGDPVTSARQ